MQKYGDRMKVKLAGRHWLTMGTGAHGEAHEDSLIHALI